MKTGIFPSGNRVVVKPDEVEEKTEGGIIIASAISEKYEHANATGTLVAVGPDAFTHTYEVTERLIDGQWKPVERKVTGYSEAFAEEGDRVAFAKYGGLVVQGEDGEKYRILNDTDITARVSDAVEFTDLKTRQRVGEK